MSRSKLPFYISILFECSLRPIDNLHIINSMTKLIKIFANSFLIFIMVISFASAEDNISGSTWVIIQEDGHKNVHRFNSDGTCPYLIQKSPSGN